MGNDFGDRVRELRRKQGWNQDELAERSNLSRVTIAKYETGMKKHPTAKTVAALANALGVTVGALLGEEELLPAGAYHPGDLQPIGIVGSIKCGPGGLAYEDREGYGYAAVRNPEDYIYLRVTGDSMEPDIRAGQLALIRLQDDVESGELAAVIVNGDEGMLKKVIKQGPSIILQSFNPQYPPRVYTGDEARTVHIVGKVIRTEREW